MSEWWRDAVVYQIYPRSFQDSDGDGVGDLDGIRARLDHLSWLGVDAIWLSPIYPSPGVDLGYDVADHCGVDPLFGDLGGFDALVAACHAAGIRVLLDLVPRTPRSSTRGFVPTPSGTPGPTAGPPTTGVPPSVARRGVATSAPGAGICTPTTPSSPTSTGATRRSVRRSVR